MTSTAFWFTEILDRLSSSQHTLSDMKSLNSREMLLIEIQQNVDYSNYLSFCSSWHTQMTTGNKVSPHDAARINGYRQWIEIFKNIDCAGEIKVGLLDIMLSYSFSPWLTFDISCNNQQRLIFLYK